MLNYIRRYFRRNSAKVLSFILLVAIGVAGAGILSSIFVSFGATREEMLAGTTRWIRITASPSLGDVAWKEVMQTAKGTANEFSGIERILEVDVAYLSYDLFGAATANFPVYGIAPEHIPWVLDRVGVQMTAGRPVRAGTNEVMMPSAFLRANGLEVGNFYREEGEYATGGHYQVVAALEGELLVGLGPAGISGGQTRALLVFAPEDILSRLERELIKRLEDWDVYVRGPIRTRSALNNSYRSYFFSAFAISIGLAAVFSLGLTVFQSGGIKMRRKEFATLRVCGWQRGKIYALVVVETLAQLAAGWLIGWLATIAGVRVLQTSLFRPSGLFAGETATLLPLSLLIPGLTLLAILFMARRHTGDDPVQVLKGQFGGEKAGQGGRWRQMSTAWLRYPLRTGAYRPEFLGLAAFVATLVLLSLLVYSMTGGIARTGELFDQLSIIRTREPLKAQTVAKLRELQGVKSVVPGAVVSINQKLLLGTGKVYLPCVRPELAGRLGLGLPQNTPPRSTAYLSPALAASLGVTNGDGLKIKQQESVVRVSPELPGLSGVIVTEKLVASPAAIIAFAGGSSREIGTALRQILSGNERVKAIVDQREITRLIEQETRFLRTLSTIIIYLEFFVLLVLAAFNSFKTARARQREMAIMSIIGVDKAKIIGQVFAERAATIIAGCGCGLLAGLGIWQLLTAVCFSGIYVARGITPGLIGRVLVLSLTVLAVTSLFARRAAFARDPLSLLRN